ncbi:HAMP domain-containing histidine kinase [Actinocorallia sp. API 0066]|uniref:sensor histidine kinase n=1 Tax=Actinocorallia sp. API 0066 TaxID=2896846 RepID=UPI001E35000F|nr:HAMP domain-containing sensor histidine kinase [Actinocorallia sp. API 0066]MCD0451966.1 HAMP domain-containing histidine kinase [Actinocorallia sp. API 0066]
MTSPKTLFKDLRQLPRRVSVRLRLTLLYGALFFFAGCLLMLVTYVFVGQSFSDVLPPGEQLTYRAPGGFPTIVAEVDDLRQNMLAQLVKRMVFALAGVGLLALVLGYIVADRALAPLHEITSAAQRLSESTLHERIALEGPEDEIKELADTFDAMLARLSEAFDSQRRFVANASHELRTPLAINRTLLEVALTDPDVSPDLVTVGRTLLATNARHERLIEGLLLLARSERELTTRKSVDLREVTETVLDSVRKRPDDERADVTLHTELTSAVTVGDPVLLEHLVHNLVDNALKHNVEGGEVYLRTGVLDGFAAVQVENSGQAIPAYEIDRLFEPFRRLHNDRIESAKGAGLGLSIVRSVVTAHRGSVVASPRPGGGLIVTVRLPFQPPPPATK